MFGKLLEQEDNCGYKFGSYSTIAMPSSGVHAVGAILTDLILWCDKKSANPPIFLARQYLMCSHKYSDPQHSVSQQDCRNLSCSVYNSLPSLVLKGVSIRAGTLPLCPLTLSSPSTLTRKSVNASSVVYVYEVTLAGTGLLIG